jgi:hypothetical protein
MLLFWDVLGDTDRYKFVYIDPGPDIVILMKQRRAYMSEIGLKDR